MPQTLPECPSCSSPDGLKAEWTEMGVQFCTCECCGKDCRVDHNGRVYRAEPRRTDLSGNEMYE